MGDIPEHSIVWMKPVIPTLEKNLPAYNMLPFNVRVEKNFFNSPFRAH